MPYLISISSLLFESRTSDLRAFGGTFRFTSNMEDAKRFTRKTDAEKRIKVLMFRPQPAFEHLKLVEV